MSWRRLFPILFGLAMVIGFVGCSVKRTVTVRVPAKVREARAASIDEVLGFLRSYADRVAALSSTSMRITFTSGKIEGGQLQAYRSAPGYLLLQRPNSIRLNVQNPLTKTAILELASAGDEFWLWYPGDNKFYTGKNSMKEFDLEGQRAAPTFTARPIHIFDAILPQTISLEEPGLRISMREERDFTARYYIVSVFRQQEGPRLLPVRDIWLERSDFTVSKQQVYTEQGAIASRITYSNLAAVEGILLPLTIQIDRPLDGYSLNMEFKSWNLNPDLPKEAFGLTSPPSAEHIELKGKDEHR